MSENSTEHSPGPSNGPFTGRHMAAILVCGFGIVIAVNLVMARAAISTFGGVVVENSYVASQHFNRWLDEAQKEKALGWRVSMVRKPDGRVLATTSGVPAGAMVRADARHPLGRLPDTMLQFESAGGGNYISTAPLPAGRWAVRVEIAHGAEKWRGEEALP